MDNNTATVLVVLIICVSVVINKFLKAVCYKNEKEKNEE